MKNHAFLLLILIPWAADCQEKFTLRPVVLPNKKYTISTSSISDATIDFKGSQAKINEMKAKGVVLPIRFTSGVDMVVSRTTGKPNNGKFPVTIIFESAKSKQHVNGRDTQRDEVVSGVRVKGSYNPEGHLKTDTVICDRFSDEMKESFKGSVDELQQPINFTKRQLAVGDSFVQEMPMEIPLPGLPAIKIIIDTKYVLKQVVAGIAMFDFTQTARLDKSQPDMVKATGKGAGTAQFSIISSCLILHKEVINVDITATVQDLTMVAKVAVTSSQTIKIQ